MLYIPFPKNNDIGGPVTFMSNLQNYLDRVKYKYTNNLHEASAIFFPIEYDLKILAKFKLKAKPIIQRLAGPYYPSQHGNKYQEINKGMQTIYQNYANLIIFQSNYSQDSCVAMFGECLENNCTVIYNGVDKQIFSSVKNPINKKFTFITTGNFRKKAMLEPIVLALDNLQEQYDFKWIVLGKIDEAFTTYLERDYINFEGKKSKQEISTCLQSANIYLHSQLNDNCPNSVIEAISCGLPVVGFDSGAMSELCYFSKDLLAPVSKDLFQLYKDFNPKFLEEKIQYAFENYDMVKQRALNHAHLYPFSECGDNYIKIFEKVLQQKESFVSKKKTYFIPVEKFMKSKISNKVLKYFATKYFENLNSENFKQKYISILNNKTSKFSPFESAKLLMELDNLTYNLQEQASVRFGKGKDSKHRHICYHDFFTANIQAGKSVLDIGSQLGNLTNSIARKAFPGKVIGVEVQKEKVEEAQKKYKSENLNFIHGDATSVNIKLNFDVVTLSNVLEHIEKRTDFLIKLKNKYKPEKFIIRVPMFERDWRVRFKRELGVSYWLDSEHYIEYTSKEFRNEMSTVGLNIEHIQYNWGEIWAVLSPANSGYKSN